MRIKVTGRSIEITPALRDYAQEKAGKLEEFYRNIQKVEVILEARSIDDANRRQVAEIRAWLAGKKMVQATEAGRDAYAAIDMAIEEAKRQIQRHKQKHVQEQRRKAGALKHELAETYVEEETGPVLVKIDRSAKKPMNLEEAKAELKVLKQDFLAFRNADNNDEINVVRRIGQEIEVLRPEKDLLPEEAVDELKKTNNNLILFKNKSSQIPSIVFRRKSGNFGLIEPEF